MPHFVGTRVLVTALVAVLAVWSAVPQVHAQTGLLPAPPDGRVLLDQSVAGMHSSLHAVHASGNDTVRQGKAQMKLRVTGDCVMQPDGIRSAFRAWGTRLTNAGTSGVAPERYDRQFVLIFSSDFKTIHIWERNALTDRRWHENNSNNDALIVFTLCPATAQFGQVFPAGATVTNLGAATVGDAVTWHLRQQQTQTHGHQSNRFRIDVYLDQTTHDVVKIRSDAARQGKTQYRDTWSRTFSQFNRPVDIQPPTQATVETASR